MLPYNVPEKQPTLVNPIKRDVPEYLEILSPMLEWCYQVILKMYANPEVEYLYVLLFAEAFEDDQVEDRYCMYIPWRFNVIEVHYTRRIPNKYTHTHKELKTTVCGVPNMIFFCVLFIRQTNQLLDDL